MKTPQLRSLPGHNSKHTAGVLELSRFAEQSTVFQFPLLNQVANYPPVAALSETFEDSELITAMSSDVDSIAPLHVNVQFPKVEETTGFEDFIFAVRQEMALMRLQMNLSTRPVTYLNWSGLSCAQMNVAELTQLMHYIGRYFKLNQQADRLYSIDVDPRYLDRGKIDLMRGLGFNRLNLLVLDFDADVAAAKDKDDFSDMLTAQFDYARKHAFSSLGLTIHCCQPGQTREVLEHNLMKMVALAPDEINYQCCNSVANENLLRPLNHTHAYEVFNILTDHGYEYIGFNHYISREAIANKRNTLRSRDRNSQQHTVHDIEQIGIGPGAISQCREVSTQNAGDFTVYQNELNNHRLPFARGVLLTKYHKIRKCIIEQLITQHRIDVKLLELDYEFDFQHYFAKEMVYLNDLLDDGLIVWDKTKRIVLVETPLLIEELCLLFNEYEEP